MKKRKIDKAIEYIAGYCEKQRDCSKCPLFSRGTCECKLNLGIPVNWVLPGWGEWEDSDND